ncbi:MAG: hypothetical protein V4628_01735 [Pseudomonadota bacterium]
MKTTKTRMLGLLAIIAATFLPKVYATPLDTGLIAITPNTLNTTVIPTSNELVTIGVPLSGCVLTDLTKFRLLDENHQEVPIFIKHTLLWQASRSPCLTFSARAVKVQFVYDATRGVRTYTWDLAGRNTALDLPESPISEVVTDNPLKDGRHEPRVFGINDPEYLAKSGIVPPTAGVTRDVFDTGYLPTIWEDTSRTFNYTTSGVTDWIYDRVSTNYRQAIRRGELEYYREAYLSHEWFISKMEVTGNNTSVANYCLGGFSFQKKAHTYGDGGGGCDTKYIYLQPYKLHLALTGDDSWQPAENGIPSASGRMNTRNQAWITSAHLLVSGDVRGGVVANMPAIPAAGFSKPYNALNIRFTERDLGFGLQAVLNACELSLDTVVCSWADTIVDNIREMQVANPDGIQHYGYLSHSLRMHEDENFLPWIGSLLTSYSEATSITVDDTFADGYLDLTAGKTIRVGKSQNPKLASNAINNGDGTWTLSLTTPVTAAAGTSVVAVFLQNSSNVDFDHPTDRIFSPWMQAITADAVWQYFNWTDNSVRREKAASILLGFARAYTVYALDGSQLLPTTKALIEQAFTDYGEVRIFSSTHKSSPCTVVKTAPYTAYFGNALMVTPDMNQKYMAFVSELGGYNREHIPEGFFQLSLGVLFETDQAKRAAMLAVLTDLHEWFEKYTCTGNIGDNRAYSWSNRLDPFGTYTYVKNHIVTPEPNPATDPVLISIADKAVPNPVVVAANASISTAGFKVAASRDSGASVQNTFVGNDEVIIAGNVQPQPVDVGSAGGVYIVIRTTTATGDEWTYRDINGNFHPWDGRIPTLTPAYLVDDFQLSDAFKIYSGKMVSATHRVFIGYRRNGSNILHYTGQAVLLQVTN